jgi:PKD repeat protein
MNPTSTGFNASQMQLIAISSTGQRDTFYFGDLENSGRGITKIFRAADGSYGFVTKFSGRPDTTVWDFGDGQQVSLTVPHSRWGTELDTAYHTYGAAGNYKVVLKAKHYDCTTIQTTNINVQPASVGSIISASDISVFPNPAKSQLFIKAEKLTPEVTVSIYDMVGRCIFTSSYRSFSSATIDLKGYKAGVYVVGIHAASTYASYPLLISN